MTKKINPFKPNHHIYTGTFTGRYNEIKRIDNILFQTKNSNPTNIMIIGERGIGKSSLLLLTNYFASGDVTFEDDKYNFATVNLSIDKNTTIIDLARKIQNSLERNLRGDEKALAALKNIWGFVKRLDTQWLKIREKEFSQSELIDNFMFSLVDTVKSLTDDQKLSTLGLGCKKDGLIILIDEADNAAADLNLGTFIKLFSEKMVAENCNKVLMVLAGLPNLRDVLKESHESVLRIFEEIRLTPLSPSEVKDVVKKGLQEAKTLNGFEIGIDDEALEAIIIYSEGYPHFVQQIGYSTFDLDQDNFITKEDVRNAMFIKSGIIDLLGDRYYKDLYFKMINQQSYRDILKIMAEKWNDWISKKEIREKFKGKASTLDNGLKALCDRHIILRQEGTKGLYRLQWASFAFWIKNIKLIENGVENI